MTFTDALCEKNKGINFKRAGWPDGQVARLSWVVVQNRYELRMDRPGDMCSTWEPSEEDKNATDWELAPGQEQPEQETEPNPDEE